VIAARVARQWRRWATVVMDCKARLTPVLRLACRDGRGPRRRRCAAAAVKGLWRERGLTLVETLVGLALLSLISMAMFQSITIWLLLSTQTSMHAQGAVSGAISSQQFQWVVRGLTPAWPEEDEKIFSGTPRGFSGISRRPLESASPGMGVISMTVEIDGGEAKLTYRSGDLSWPFLRASIREGAFTYLAADGTWRQEWPPETSPEAGPFDDAIFAPTPQLPLAIRFEYTMQTGDKKVLLSDIGSDPVNPNRLKDIVGE